MSIITAPENNALDPRIKEALQGFLKNKQLQEEKFRQQQKVNNPAMPQPEMASPIVTPQQQEQEVNAYKQNPMPSMTPITKTPQVIPSVVPAPTINDDYRGDVTDRFRSNNPDQPTLKEEETLLPKYVLPKTVKDYNKLPQEQKDRVVRDMQEKNLYFDPKDIPGTEAVLRSYHNENLQPKKEMTMQQQFDALPPEEQVKVNAKLAKLGQPLWNKTDNSTTKKTVETGTTTETPQEYFEKTGMNPLTAYLESLKPKRNEVTEGRLKRIAAANAIGEGLRTIADAAYADKGSYGSSITKHENKFTPQALADLRQREFKFDADSKNYGIQKLQQMMSQRAEWLSNKRHKETLESTTNREALKLAWDKQKHDDDLKAKYAGIKSHSADARYAADHKADGKEDKYSVFDKDTNSEHKLTKGQYYEALSNIVDADISEIATKNNLLDKDGNPDRSLVMKYLYEYPNSNMANEMVQRSWKRIFEPNGSGVKPKTSKFKKEKANLVKE